MAIMDTRSCTIRRLGSRVRVSFGAQYVYDEVDGVRLSLNGHTVYPPNDIRIWSPGGMILAGVNKTLRETCPSASPSTTNPTSTHPGANTGLRRERPATNRLSYVTTGAQGCVIRCRKSCCNSEMPH
jgi:hypothetical protein